MSTNIFDTGLRTTSKQQPQPIEVDCELVESDDEDADQEEAIKLLSQMTSKEIRQCVHAAFVNIHRNLLFLPQLDEGDCDTLIKLLKDNILTLVDNDQSSMEFFIGAEYGELKTNLPRMTLTPCKDPNGLYRCVAVTTHIDLCSEIITIGSLRSPDSDIMKTITKGGCYRILNPNVPSQAEIKALIKSGLIRPSY